MNKHETIMDTDTRQPIKPSTIRRAAAVIVGVSALVSGCINTGTEKTVSPSPVETVKNIPPKTDDGKVPGPINEPGTNNPGVASPRSEIGSAASVEKATTPEQNAEYQMAATALATSVIDLYNQGIGTENAMHEGEETYGSRIINVKNVANDNSGFYVLTTQLPAGSMNPAEVVSVSVAMYSGEANDNQAVDTNGDGGYDNRTLLYSMNMDNNSGTGWELSSEVDTSIDVNAIVGPESKQPQVDFAQQVISRAADGAPVG